MAGKKVNPRIVSVFVAAQGLLGSATVRDLKKRSKKEVRGPKWFWYLWGGSNMLGTITYWTIGRRRHA